MKPMTEEHFAILRRHMVELIELHADLLSEEIGRTKLDERTLAAVGRVPRHHFVPAQLASLAYHDTPLPIGFDKTISQPFLVALMTDLLGPQAHETVLEVGTGLGYQAAILAELACAVMSVEIVEEFGTEAGARLARHGYRNVEIRIGDGSRGWPQHAPFDKILIAAAAEKPPAPLLDQLKPGGRMVLPLGSAEGQLLTVIEKNIAGNIAGRASLPVRFGQLETVA